MARFDAKGRHIPDPTPVEIPTGVRTPLSLADEIKRYVRHELSIRADAAQYETFQEADDFDVEEDDVEDWVSPYEVLDLIPERHDRDGDPPGKPGDPPPAHERPSIGGSSPAEPPAPQGAGSGAPTVEARNPQSIT